MNIFKKVVLAAIVASATLGHAYAETVTFDDIPLGGGANNAYWGDAYITSGGFSFSLKTEVLNIVTNAQVCSPSCPVNGTNIMLLPYGISSLTMTKSDGGNFDLFGFDGAGSFNFNESGLPTYIPNQIDVVGSVADGSQVTQSFMIDKSVQAGPLSFSSYTFNELFANLTSVSFSSSGSQGSRTYNGFAIDNISVSAVPEPTTVALLGLGLLAVSASRRKSTKSKDA